MFISSHFCDFFLQEQTETQTLTYNYRLVIIPDANIPTEICYFKQRTLPHFETLSTTLETADKKIEPSGIHCQIYQAFSDKLKDWQTRPSFISQVNVSQCTEGYSYVTALHLVQFCNANHKVQLISTDCLSNRWTIPA